MQDITGWNKVGTIHKQFIHVTKALMTHLTWKEITKIFPILVFYFILDFHSAKIMLERPWQTILI